jgi:hypothetical protein
MAEHIVTGSIPEVIGHGQLLDFFQRLEIELQSDGLLTREPVRQLTVAEGDRMPDNNKRCEDCACREAAAAVVVGDVAFRENKVRAVGSGAYGQVAVKVAVVDLTPAA